VDLESLSTHYKDANFLYMQDDNDEVCSGDINELASKSCNGVSFV